MSTPSTIGSLNLLNQAEKRSIFARIVPPEILDRFHLSPFLVDKNGNDLLHLKAQPGQSSVEIALYHRHHFPDPTLYGHLTDTVTGNLHILLYIINDPDSPRFDVDRLSDGTPTQFGTQQRNKPAELAALNAGLNPGQIRKGLHLLTNAISTFEKFVENLGHDIYFTEPLYYHNAVIFEKYGFAYQQGQREMRQIDTGFSANGNLAEKLDNSTPFRKETAKNSIRLRSWAIHDGVLGEPFTNVTMYKRIGQHAGVVTTQCAW